MENVKPLTKKEFSTITVTLFFSGADTKAARLTAAEKILSRCHPVVVDGKVLQLERYEIQDGS
jgi:hypothetical protein